MAKELILVDENDAVVGYGEKMQVHREGRLHRAFSIFVVNNHGQLLLQQRAAGKYHSPGLWANTCCSHPYRDEPIEETIHTRLMEEMGFDCPLQPMFSFIYKAEFGNGLTEYEYDHVFLGRYENAPDPNPAEVQNWRWINLDELKIDLALHPERYVYWLGAAFGEFYEKYGRLVREV